MCPLSLAFVFEHLFSLFNMNLGRALLKWLFQINLANFTAGSFSDQTAVMVVVMIVMVVVMVEMVGGEKTDIVCGKLETTFLERWKGIVVAIFCFIFIYLFLFFFIFWQKWGVFPSFLGNAFFGVFTEMFARVTTRFKC